MLLRIEKRNEDFAIRDAHADHLAGETVGRLFASGDRSDAEFIILRGEHCTTRLPSSAVGRLPNPLEMAITSVGFYESKYPWRWRRTRHGEIEVRRMKNGWVVRLNGCYLMDNETGWAAEFPTRVLAERAASAQATERRRGREFRRDGFYWEEATETAGPGRIEHRLGQVAADATSRMARALIEKLGTGVTTGTRERIGEVIAHLEAIWFASLFGAYRPEIRVFEPYFAGEHGRMSFPAAYEHYGMAELRRRFPDVDDDVLQQVLSWPLELLRSTVLALRPSSAVLPVGEAVNDVLRQMTDKEMRDLIACAPEFFANPPQQRAA